MCNLFFRTELSRKFESYPDLEVLTKAKGSKTWYGSRIFTVEGINGSMPIDKISKKFIATGKRNTRDGYLDAEDRKKITKMVVIARKLYIESDSTTSKIANFLNSIREYFLGKAIRCDIESESIISNLQDYSHKRLPVSEDPEIL